MDNEDQDHTLTPHPTIAEDESNDILEKPLKGRFVFIPNIDVAVRPVLVFNRIQFILYINPLTSTVIQKLLEIIGRVRLCPSCSFATALDLDINQTTGSGGHLSM